MSSKENFYFMRFTAYLLTPTVEMVYFIKHNIIMLTYMIK